MRQISVLGSTGSIGTQTLQVVRNNRDIHVAALAAGSNVDLIEQQIREFRPELAVLWEEKKAEELKLRVADLDVKVSWGMDLNTEHERYLSEQVVKGPVFLTDYPKDIKAFYMRLNDDGKTVAACDLLVPHVGELVGGSQREERLDLLEKRMDELGMDKEGYQWYLDLRRYGGCKHAGFGLGFERMVMYLTGMENIRDVLPYPRTPKNLIY